MAPIPESETSVPTKSSLSGSIKYSGIACMAAALKASTSSVEFRTGLDQVPLWCLSSGQVNLVILGICSYR